MFVYTADLAMQVSGASQFGLAATLERVDWPAIRDRIITRVDESSHAGRRERTESTNCTVLDGRARFTGPHELVINDDTRIEAEQIVIATGGRPAIPPVVKNAGIEFHTSDTILRLDALPASMVILGGGYVAVEWAHVFSSFGVDIHIVERAATLMEALDAEISKRFTDQNAKRWNVHLDATVTTSGRTRTTWWSSSKTARELPGNCYSSQRDGATQHRRPRLDVAGVTLVGRRARCRRQLRAGAHRVSGALGDCSSPFELKHVATCRKPRLSPTPGSP